MNEIKKTNIENLIYKIRGQQVMLDRDLAYLYQIETRTLNQKVKRNINRFPKEFCFQMTEEEFKIWKSQIVMSNKDKIGLRRPPFVFTEQGVAMLSAIINTEIAIITSIRIIKAFVSMKKYITTNLFEQKYYNDMVVQHDTEIKLLQESFNKLQNTTKINEIFFNGQIFDSYSLLIDIFNSAKEKIIIIDNYIDKNILDILSKIQSEILIITNKYNVCDIKKYKEQYNNLNLKINNDFHDRFIIIDNKTLYHSGASFKDLGKKCFAINKIEDKDFLEKILNKII